MRHLIIISGFLFLMGCAGWTVNGIDAERFKDAGGKEVALLGIGAASSFAVHVAGHYLYCEAEGIGLEQRGLEERYSGDATNKQRRWMGRAGFLAQLTGGTALRLACNETWFTVGYNAGSFIQVSAYPLRRDEYGDLHEIDRGGGDPYLEWAGFTAWSWLLLGVER